MKRMSPRWGGLLLGLLLVLEPACSNSEQPPTGTDAGVDGGLPGSDGGISGPDGGSPGPDAGTTSRKPYGVFVVDRSASMLSPVDATDPDCRMPDGTVCGTRGQDNCNPTVCPTRLSSMRSQLELFMASRATQARYGLAFFPATVSGSSTPAEACTASAQMRVSPPTEDEPALLQLAADGVLQAIRNVPAPAGSSPLGDTLEMVMRETPLGSAAAMPGDVVVLITDGLPNCNADNPYDGTHPSCRCTVSTGCTGPVARLGCLDLEAPVALVSGLRQRGVRTYVLPVGTDALAGDGPSVFNALAEAGGTARDCPQGTQAECGGSNTCDTATRRCTWRFLGPGELERIFAP